MRTGGKRKILVKSGGSKSQPLDTNPRHECSQRGPIGTRNTAPHRPDGLRSPPSGGACYRELPRIPLPRTPVNRGESTQTLSCLWWKGLEPAASKRATGRREEATNAAVHDAVRLHH